MPTRQSEPFRQRQAAESFGADAERYDRSRPRYPAALIDRIVDRSPGRDVLDVGIGTGIVARQLRAAGCRVLGVEPDPRMAAFARAGGLQVDVSTFEAWDPAGRTFDAVVAGQTWHWVDPDAGAAKAAAVLRPGGLLALFWNAGQPSAPAAAAFAEVYERLMPGSVAAKLYRSPASAAAVYLGGFDKVEEALRATGAFAADGERWSFEWEQVYTAAEWIDQVLTLGTNTSLPPEQSAALVSAMADAVDALGGSFTMHFTTVATTALRRA